MQGSKYTTVDEYIENAPVESQDGLRKLRELVKEEAPEAEEMIAYEMPAYKLNNKPLIYFAGYKNHIGVYPTPSANEALSKEVGQYVKGKGTLQFQLSEPLPYDLIRKVVRYKKEELSKK